MKLEHRIIRKMLRQLPVPAARELLQANLPEHEYRAIYHVDVARETLLDAGRKHLHCEEPTVKKYRRSGYEKLAFLYFPKT